MQMAGGIEIEQESGQLVQRAYAMDRETQFYIDDTAGFIVGVRPIGKRG